MGESYNRSNVVMVTRGSNYERYSFNYLMRDYESSFISSCPWFITYSSLVNDNKREKSES